MSELNLGGGIPKLGSGPKVDPRDYPTKRCSKCGGIIFKSCMILKEIPGAVVGQGGEPIMYPLQVLVCDNCGAILDEDIKAYKLEKEFNEPNKEKTVIV